MFTSFNPATFNFTIHYKTNPNESLYILGNIPEFGSWTDPIFPLTLNDNNYWNGSITFSKTDQIIQYKFVVIDKQTNTFLWEKGPNRLLCSNAISHLPQDDITSFHINAIWEHFIIEFNIYYPLKNDFDSFQLSTTLPEQSSSSHSPIKMTLSDNKELPSIHHSQINGKFWTVTLPLNINLYNETICEFEYKYSIYNSLKKCAVWEREPNRKCRIVTNINSDIQKEWIRKEKGVKLLINSYIVLHDEEFVSLFKYDKIGKMPLYVGPYPQDGKDLLILKRIGVKTVLNVMSEEDVKYRGVDVKGNDMFCKENGIDVIYCEIDEKKENEVELKLKEGADIIHNAIDDESNIKTIYIHCTSGMNSSVDVIVMYLVLYREYSLQQAGEYVKTFRRVACVNYNVIQNALYRINPEKYKKEDSNIIAAMSHIDSNNNNMNEESDDNEDEDD